MATTYKRLTRYVLSGDDTIDTVYTCPALTEATCVHLRIVNDNDTDTATVRVYLAGNTTDYLFQPAITILANGFIEDTAYWAIDAGESVYVQSDLSDVVVWMFGMEKT